MRGLFDWYGGLSLCWRFGVSLVFLLISTLMWLLADRIWIWGWVIGGVLLVFAFPTEGEKRGYHDF